MHLKYHCNNSFTQTDTQMDGRMDGRTIKIFRVPEVCLYEPG
jgi:hypothetical protein